MARVDRAEETDSAVVDRDRERSLAATAAVGALVDEFGPRLHAVALRLCGHRADADDLVQEVFLIALRKWHTFRGDANPGTWLFSIAARACKARLRRKGGIDRRTPALSQLMPWGETRITALAAGEEDDPAEHREAIERVQSAITRLPEHLRLPVVLKEVLGMSVDDAAAALALNPSTVKTRLHRARLALRKALLSKSRLVEAPAPIYEKMVCMDLLKAKMDSLDRAAAGASAKIPQAEICSRCRSVFREFDIVSDACSQLAGGAMPQALRRSILKALAARGGSNADTSGRSPARRGRRPVGSST